MLSIFIIKWTFIYYKNQKKKTFQDPKLNRSNFKEIIRETHEAKK